MRILPLLLLTIGCHFHQAAAPTASAPPPARTPLPSPEQRVATAMAAWGDALVSGSDARLATTEDRAGRFAFAYVGIKAASRRVPNGQGAVERTLVMFVLQSLFPNQLGSPQDTWYAYVPTSGPIGPALAAAGLATQPSGEDPYAIVALPYDQTLGRLQDASARQRERLRAAAAWTCVPTEIVHSVPPTEPTLVKAASISRHVFKSWLDTVDALWLVRAQCVTGPGMFVVAGHTEPNGTLRDQILIAHVTAQH